MLRLHTIANAKAALAYYSKTDGYYLAGSVSKAIANVERGSLQDYVGQKALNQFIDIDKCKLK